MEAKNIDVEKEIAIRQISQILRADDFDFVSALLSRLERHQKEFSYNQKVVNHENQIQLHRS